MQEKEDYRMLINHCISNHLSWMWKCINWVTEEKIDEKMVE